MMSLRHRRIDAVHYKHVGKCWLIKEATSWLADLTSQEHRRQWCLPGPGGLWAVGLSGGWGPQEAGAVAGQAAAHTHRHDESAID